MLSAKSLRRANWGPFDLDLAPGTCTVLTGKSGAGKSVLLRMLADLDPNDGNVMLGEIDRASVPAPAWRRQVMYVPAESGWWSDLVGDHFSAPDRALPLLEPLLLASDAMTWPVTRLSTGERQRLALIRAFALEPKVLLLDEPTSALDQAATLAVETLLRERLSTGTAILLVSHSAEQAARLADRRLVLADNRLSELP